MFRGQFVHQLDTKGRLSLPARFRDALAKSGDERVVLTLSPFDPCLHLYPIELWEEYERKIGELPMHDLQIARFRRLYISPAQDFELDKAGRLRLPVEFREKLQLGSDIMLAGMGRIVEIWDKNAWDNATEMNIDELAEFRDQVRELIRI